MQSMPRLKSIGNPPKKCLNTVCTFKETAPPPPLSALTCLNAAVQNVQVVLSDEPASVSGAVRGRHGVNKLPLSRSQNCVLTERQNDFSPPFHSYILMTTAGRSSITFRKGAAVTVPALCSHISCGFVVLRLAG